MKPEIDLSAALNYATSDPDWVRKALIAGVVFFIPFVGPFILLGWQKRLVQQALTNPEIPAIDFGPDLTEGVRVFVALLLTTLPAVAILLGVQCAGFAPAFALGGVENEGVRAVVTMATSLLMLVGTGIFMVLMLGYQVLMPDLLRRIFRGETTPLLSLGRTVDAIKRQPTPYVVAFAGIWLAQIIGSLGVLFCFVGLVLTYPLSLLILSHILAQWDRIAGASEAELAQIGG
jgi:hypothetical protein